MGLFGSIKDTFRKSEAAVVVQNLLEHQARVGLFDQNSAAFANAIIEAVWQSKPDIFSGKFGQRPHKIATAAIALASASARLTDENRMAVLISLGNVLSEVERNGPLYPFNSMDAHLFEAAGKVFVEAAEEMGMDL
jgi:UDP-glucose 6-dehydrogenase